MIACLTPSDCDFMETLKTLQTLRTKCASTRTRQADIWQELILFKTKLHPSVIINPSPDTPSKAGSERPDQPLLTGFAVSLMYTSCDAVMRH
ncbi:hypothetical protein LSAT2_022300 [Lamellibrachia satsuma]|nr:hypothetical protein LSAT2_022300 [Lamellibrachia satsuma]